MDQGFIDIHSHIIHGVDDGSPDLASSLGLIEAAYSEGIRTMIASPHVGAKNLSYDPALAARNYEELCEHALKMHPDMHFHMGNEIFLAPGFPDGLKDGISLTLAGSPYALIEFPIGADYEYILSEFRRLILEGYIPVFAHIERYTRSVRDLDDVEELINLGVKIQVNASSLAGVPAALKKGGILSDRYREARRREKFSLKLLAEGFISYVATDCHTLPGREPIMRAAARRVAELAGEAEVQRIFVQEPREIVGE